MADEALLAAVLAETRGPSVCWSAATRAAWKAKQPPPEPEVYDDSHLTTARRRRDLDRVTADDIRTASTRRRYAN